MFPEVSCVPTVLGRECGCSLWVPLCLCLLFMRPWKRISRVNTASRQESGARAKGLPFLANAQEPSGHSLGVQSPDLLGSKAMERGTPPSCMVLPTPCPGPAGPPRGIPGQSRRGLCCESCGANGPGNPGAHLGFAFLMLSLGGIVLH